MATTRPMTNAATLNTKKNSDGMETDISGLFGQVAARTENREIPDGSTDRLERAGTAWRAFADHDIDVVQASEIEADLGGGLTAGGEEAALGRR